jgi:hypothetical protein
MVSMQKCYLIRKYKYQYLLTHMAHKSCGWKHLGMRATVASALNKSSVTGAQPSL